MRANSAPTDFRRATTSSPRKAARSTIRSSKLPTASRPRRAIAELELDDVDIDSFLHLSGDHYYTYPALVRERAAAIRTGKLTVEGA